MNGKRSIGVTIFSYLGVIFGVFSLLGESGINLKPIGIFLTLSYVVLSYNLLKLKNWSRVTLLIINTVWVVLITIVYLLVFLVTIWVVWIGTRMNGSLFETLKIMYPSVKFSEIFKSIFPYNIAIGFVIFLIYNIYLYGFLMLFTRPKVKAQFTGVLIENKPILRRVMKKCLPYFAAVSLALVIYLGISQYISYVINKRLRVEARKDPLACAFYTARKIKRDGIKYELLTKIAVEYASNAKFNKALEVAKTIAFDVTRADALSQISSEYIKAGQIENSQPLLSQALQIANKQKQVSFLKAKLLSTIVVKYAEANKYVEALQLADTINEPSCKARALVEVAFLYAKAGQKEKAVGLLNQSLEAVGKEDNSAIKNERLCDIAEKYAEFGQYDNALNVTKMIGSACIRAAALGRVSAYYAKVGQNDKAVELLSEAVQLAGKINDNNYCLWQIPYKYVEVEQYEQALKISKEIIKDTSLQARVLIKIAARYVKSGQKDKADDMLSQAIVLTKTMESAASKIFVLENISFEYAKLGQNDKASNILSEALQETKALKKDFEQEVCLEIIAVKYAENEQYDQAIHVANTIKAVNFRNKALVEIALKYAESGQKIIKNGKNILDEIIKKLE